MREVRNEREDIAQLVECALVDLAEGNASTVFDLPSMIRRRTCEEIGHSMVLDAVGRQTVIRCRRCEDSARGASLPKGESA